MKPTIVTGLFNINREAFEGYKRQWATYLEWFKNCLSLDCDLVTFVDEGMEKFIEANRNFPTKVIPIKLSEFRLYRHVDKMQEVMNSRKFKAKVTDPIAPEVTRPLYNVVTYSKVSMMKMAADLNPFNGDYFIWIDAGCMHDRFLPRYKGIRFPNDDRLSLLNHDKIYMTCYKKPMPQDRNLAEYLCTNPPGKKRRLTAFIIGSNKNNLAPFEDFLDAYLDETLSINLVDSEQLAFNNYYLKNPEKFDLCMFHPKTTWFTGFINLIEEIK